MHVIEYDIELADYEPEEIERLGLLRMGLDDLKGVEDPMENGIIRLYCETYIDEPVDATQWSPPEYGGAQLGGIEVMVNGKMVDADIDFCPEEVDVMQEQLFAIWAEESKNWV